MFIFQELISTGNLQMQETENFNSLSKFLVYIYFVGPFCEASIYFLWGEAADKNRDSKKLCITNHIIAMQLTDEDHCRGYLYKISDEAAHSLLFACTAPKFSLSTKSCHSSLLFLPILPEYFAKAACNADLTLNSGSFFLRLLAS